MGSGISQFKPDNDLLRLRFQYLSDTSLIPRFHKIYYAAEVSTSECNAGFLFAANIRNLL